MAHNRHKHTKHTTALIYDEGCRHIATITDLNPYLHIAIKQVYSHILTAVTGSRGFASIPNCTQHLEYVPALDLTTVIFHQHRHNQLRAFRLLVGDLYNAVHAPSTYFRWLKLLPIDECSAQDSQDESKSTQEDIL